MEREDCEFLEYILKAEAGRDSLAGAMAKAAAPRPKKQRKANEKGATKEEIDEMIDDIEAGADKTLSVVFRIASES